MKHKLTLALAVFSLLIEIRGAEKIEGAFGFKLGELYPRSEADKLANKTDFEFTPTNGYRVFKFYSLTVTPKTGQICSILAHGPVKSITTARAEQQDLMDLLSDKYGNATPDGTASGRAMSTKVITQDKRVVESYIHTTPSGVVVLVTSYKDLDLMELFRKERVGEIKKKG
ncbi:MAG: hypothetical protein HY300_21110, partial [Verrucomicrobia bacterium]|nr:hypothetical protein [Verrucomicrobiota bacterium]